jgi:hypothetical protein
VVASERRTYTGIDPDEKDPNARANPVAQPGKRACATCRQAPFL